MPKLRHFFVTVALVATSHAASAGEADSALSVFLTCDSGALAKIGDSKAVFGPVTITSRSGEKPSKPPATYELDEAAFAKPVEAHGLHLFAFVHYVVMSEGKRRAVSFGFRAAEPAPKVAAAIGSLMKDVESQQVGDEFGWLVELEPAWHTDGDGSAIEHRHPVRFLHVSPSPVESRPDATMIECDLAEAKVAPTPPPKLADIFVVAAPGRTTTR